MKSVMASYFWQYIVELTFANFRRYPIRRHVAIASALELLLDSDLVCYVYKLFINQHVWPTYTSHL